MKIKVSLIFILLFFTFSSCSVEKYDDNIVPIDKSGFNKGEPKDSVSLRWKKLLNYTCDNVLNDWWIQYKSELKGAEEIDFGYLENNSKTGEFGQETKGGIRPAAQSAYSIAVALFTNAYDSDITGVSNDEALNCALLIVKSLAKDHMANEGIGHPWGNQWQSAQWASKTAITGWILWDYLNESDKKNLFRMIEYEANRFLEKKPATANEDYVNDTHAEEDGWDATGIQTACALLPNHKNFKLWLDKSIEYRLNALATPSDMQNKNMVDNKVVKEHVYGYNVDSLGALGNHKAYPHPDYMAAPLRHTTEGSLFLKLAKLPIPEANSFNCSLVYGNLVNYVWNNESTIFKEDGSVYWPIGIESDRKYEFITFGIIDLGAQYLGYEELTSKDGSFWEKLHTKKAAEIKLTGFAAASAYLFRWLEFQNK